MPLSPLEQERLLECLSKVAKEILATIEVAEEHGRHVHEKLEWALLTISDLAVKIGKGGGTKLEGRSQEDLAKLVYWKALKHTRAEFWRKELQERKRIERLKEQGQRTSDNPAEVLERKDVHRILRECISKLPDLYREVVEAVDIGGEQEEDVAQRTGIKCSTVRKRRERARKKLRDCMASKLVSNEHIATI